MDSEVVNFFQNLNIITTFKKDLILIHKYSPRIYRIPKDVFFPLRKSFKIKPDLIRDYINLKRWLFLPDKKRQKYYNNTIPSFLGLRVSEDCNMECRYCYNKYNMLNKKGIKYMSKEIAIKALIFFLSYLKKEEAWIFFLGGEPLLNFPVIKETVEYIKEIKNRGFKIRIVTNGTIMNKDILTWIAGNDIEIVVALDLPPSEQNRNRPLKNGSPSFEIVKNNLSMLAKNIPKKNLFIRTVITRNVSLSDAYRSFCKLGLPIVNFSPEQEINNIFCKYGLKTFHKNFKIQRRRFKKNILKHLVTDRNNCFNHLSLYKGEILDTPLDIIIKGRVKMSGCQTDEINRINVNPVGEIYFCGLVVNIEQFYLGNVETGIDKENFKNIKEKYNLKYSKECMNCWAYSFCIPICNAKTRKENCQQMKRDFIEELRFFLDLNYNQIEKILKYILYASNDKNYIRSQEYNFKIAQQTYKFLNETNKYIKPVNILPF